MRIKGVQVHKVSHTKLFNTNLLLEGCLNLETIKRADAQNYTGAACVYQFSWSMMFFIVRGTKGIKSLKRSNIGKCSLFWMERYNLRWGFYFLASFGSHLIRHWWITEEEPQVPAQQCSQRHRFFIVLFNWKFLYVLAAITLEISLPI